MAVLLLIIAAGCAGRGTPAATSTPAGAESITPAPSDLAGERIGLEMRDSPEMIESEDLAVAGGARWFRIPFRWRLLEPRRSDPPEYQWERYDGLIQELSRRGLRVILTVRDDPEWASAGVCGQFSDEGAAAFPEFLEAAVRRYSAAPYGVLHWELYNEPDNASKTYVSQGGCWGGSPAAYAEMLGQAYAAIKRANGEAVVVFGGIALEKIEGDPFNVRFLEEVLAAGGGPYFDWMNFHYYPAFSYRWDRFGPGVAGKAAYVRKLLADAGVEKPLICTEIGQPSAGPPAEGYSDEKAMAHVYKGLVQAIAADLRVVIWHRFQDQEGDTRLYGLLSPEGTPKPAYQAFQTLTHNLAQAHYQGPFENPAGNRGLAAYRFFLEDSGDGYTTLVAAWCADEGQSATLVLQATSVSILDVRGRETVVADGGPADREGQAGRIGLSISDEPVLLRY